MSALYKVSHTISPKQAVLFGETDKYTVKSFSKPVNSRVTLKDNSNTILEKDFRTTSNSASNGNLSSSRLSKYGRTALKGVGSLSLVDIVVTAGQYLYDYINNKGASFNPVAGALFSAGVSAYHTNDSKSNVQKDYFDVTNSDYQSYVDNIDSLAEQQVDSVDTQFVYESKPLPEILAKNNYDLVNAVKDLQSKTNDEILQKNAEMLKQGIDVIALQLAVSNELMFEHMELQKEMKMIDVDLHLLTEGHYANIESIARQQADAMFGVASAIDSKPMYDERIASRLKESLDIQKENAALQAEYIKEHKMPLIAEQTITHKTLNELDDDISLDDVGLFDMSHLYNRESGVDRLQEFVNNLMNGGNQ